MKYNVLSWAMNLDIPITQKLTLFVMIILSDANMVCWSTQSVIAKKVGVTERQIRNNIKYLEDNNFIKSEENEHDKRQRAHRIIPEIWRQNTGNLALLPYIESRAYQGNLGTSPGPNVPGLDASASSEIDSKFVWKHCPRMLNELSVGKKQSRSLLGKWLKNNPPEKVFRAVQSAHFAGTQDPIPYITETLKAKVEFSGGEWILRDGSKEFAAWKDFCRRICDWKKLAEFDKGEVSVKTRWPGQNVFSEPTIGSRPKAEMIFLARKGTPQFEAWMEYFKNQKKSKWILNLIENENRSTWPTKTEWPPGHENYDIKSQVSPNT